MTIIYILGTDGAGKTTIARRLAATPLGGRRLSYVYCQHRPVILWALKLPARILFMRHTEQFRNYNEYKAQKDAISLGCPRLTRLYAWMTYFDVWLQTWPKLFRARRNADVVVMDRYYLDWVVNAGVLQCNSPEGMLSDAIGLERVVPKARLHVLLDVSEETAFCRKNDIQSIQYLRERKQRYLRLVPHYGFRVVDANQDAETVFQQVKAIVQAALGPPVCRGSANNRSTTSPLALSTNGGNPEIPCLSPTPDEQGSAL